MNKLIAVVPAAALAAGLGLTACTVAAPVPAPTVTHTVTPAPAPSTPAATTAPPVAAPAPTTPAPSAPVVINNSPTIIVQTPPPPTSTVYVPITSSVPSYVSDNEGVVQEYYNDLSSGDFQDAWNLGGNNLNGNAGYNQWVAGYDTTESISLNTWSYYPDSNAVGVTITALQSNGETYTYQGSYTVSGGVIVGADIVQTGW